MNNKFKKDRLLKENIVIKLLSGGKKMRNYALIGASICAVVLLVLGSNGPAFAKTQSSLPTTILSLISTSSEEYEVHIGAGIHRLNGEGKFGWGWHTTVKNTGDTNITGFMYDKETTLSGKVISYGSGPFSLVPGMSVSAGTVNLLDFHPITLINLTVVVGNMTYSRSGYGIGPFVFLAG